MGLDPLPVHMRSPEPDPLPLRVDVINGWPLSRFLYLPSGRNYLGIYLCARCFTAISSISNRENQTINLTIIRSELLITLVMSCTGFNALCLMH